MTEQELRQLVRQAIANHRGSAPAPLPLSSPAPLAFIRDHASHGLFNIKALESDGPCIIEPTVGCNHCGYCKSYGH